MEYKDNKINAENDANYQPELFNSTLLTFL
jgi:hypothetical protein